MWSWTKSQGQTLEKAYVLQKDKRSVMNYIHLPKKTTLAKRNREWKIICNYLNSHL